MRNRNTFLIGPYCKHPLFFLWRSLQTSSTNLAASSPRNLTATGQSSSTPTNDSPRPSQNTIQQARRRFIKLSRSIQREESSNIEMGRDTSLDSLKTHPSDTVTDSHSFYNDDLLIPSMNTRNILLKQLGIDKLMPPPSPETPAHMTAATNTNAMEWRNGVTDMDGRNARFCFQASQLVQTGIQAYMPIYTIVQHLTRVHLHVEKKKRSQPLSSLPQSFSSAEIADAFSMLDPDTLLHLVQYATQKWITDCRRNRISHCNGASTDPSTLSHTTDDHSVALCMNDSQTTIYMLEEESRSAYYRWLIAPLELLLGVRAQGCVTQGESCIEERIRLLRQFFDTNETRNGPCLTVSSFTLSRSTSLLSWPALVIEILKLCTVMTHNRYLPDASGSVSGRGASSFQLESSGNVWGRGGTETSICIAERFFLGFLSDVEKTCGQRYDTSHTIQEERHGKDGQIPQLVSFAFDALWWYLQCIEGKGLIAPGPTLNMEKRQSLNPERQRALERQQRSGQPLSFALFTRLVKLFHANAHKNGVPFVKNSNEGDNEEQRLYEGTNPYWAGLPSNAAARTMVFNIISLLGPLARSVAPPSPPSSFYSRSKCTSLDLYMALKDLYESLLLTTDIGHEPEARQNCQDALQGLIVCATRCLGGPSSSSPTAHTKAVRSTSLALLDELEDLLRVFREGTSWVSLPSSPSAVASTSSSFSGGALKTMPHGNGGVQKGNAIAHLIRLSSPREPLAGSGGQAVFEGYTPSIYHAMIQAFVVAGRSDIGLLLFHRLLSPSTRSYALGLEARRQTTGRASPVPSSALAFTAASTLMHLLLSLPTCPLSSSRLQPFLTPSQREKAEKTILRERRTRALDKGFEGDEANALGKVVPANTNSNGTQQEGKGEIFRDTVDTASSLVWRRIRSFEAQGFLQAATYCALRQEFYHTAAAYLLIVFATQDAGSYKVEELIKLPDEGNISSNHKGETGGRRLFKTPESISRIYHLLALNALSHSGRSGTVCLPHEMMRTLFLRLLTLTTELRQRLLALEEEHFHSSSHFSIQMVVRDPQKLLTCLSSWVAEAVVDNERGRRSLPSTNGVHAPPSVMQVPYPILGLLHQLSHQLKDCIEWEKNHCRSSNANGRDNREEERTTTAWRHLLSWLQDTIEACCQSVSISPRPRSPRAGDMRTNRAPSHPGATSPPSSSSSPPSDFEISQEHAGNQYRRISFTVPLLDLGKLSVASAPSSDTSSRIDSRNLVALRFPRIEMAEDDHGVFARKKVPFSARVLLYSTPKTEIENIIRSFGSQMEKERDALSLDTEKLKSDRTAPVLVMSMKDYIELHVLRQHMDASLMEEKLNSSVDSKCESISQGTMAEASGMKWNSANFFESAPMTLVWERLMEGRGGSDSAQLFTVMSPTNWDLYFGEQKGNEGFDKPLHVLHLQNALQNAVEDEDIFPPVQEYQQHSPKKSPLPVSPDLSGPSWRVTDHVTEWLFRWICHGESYGEEEPALLVTSNPSVISGCRWIPRSLFSIHVPHLIHRETVGRSFGCVNAGLHYDAQTSPDTKERRDLELLSALASELSEFTPENSRE